MKIGLAYDLKEGVPLSEGQPEDALEEYDSAETVQGLAAALESLGHRVVRLGGGRELLARIIQDGVDFVFNIAEGRGNYRSREAQVPALLEMLDIPYSGSDPECLAICLDKPMTKKLVSMAGIPTPQWQVVADQRHLAGLSWNGFPLPVFIKPAYEGSSKGIRSGSRVETVEQIEATVAGLLKHYRQPVMVEEFVSGDEITVGIVGNSPPQVLGIMRVLPKQKSDCFVYSLEVKRDWENLVDYECPAQLGKPLLDKITGYSLIAFQILGCRDFARLDFRVSAAGVPYFLEINPLAGLNPRSSDLPIMARRVGLSYPALISAILQAALERYPRCLRR